MSKNSKYITKFESALNGFVDELKQYVSTESGDWTIKYFDFFVAPKWKIASDSRGSGNTANIGSIKNISDIKRGNLSQSQMFGTF